MIQSILFDKKKWNIIKAIEFLKKHNYAHSKVDETKNYYRFRQINPIIIKKEGFTHYATKPLGKSGVELIIVYKEEKGGKITAKELKEHLKESYVSPELRKQNLDDYVLDKDLSTQEQGVYYNPSTNHVIVSHRGTQKYNYKDWLNNLALGVGAYKATSRYKRGENVQKNVENKYGKQNVTTTGHSQGSQIATNVGQDSKEIIHLNPAIGSIPGKKEVIVRSKYDPVSILQYPIQKASELLYPSYAKKHYKEIEGFEHSSDALNNLPSDEIIGSGGIWKRV